MFQNIDQSPIWIRVFFKVCALTERRLTGCYPVIEWMLRCFCYCYFTSLLGNNYMTNLTMPTSLVDIREYMFYNCYNLRTVIVPT